MGVLENVRARLQPFMNANIFNVGKVHKVSAKKSPHPFRNMFAVLDVYTPSKAFMDAPDVAVPPASRTEYAVEDENSWEDAVFALVSLLDDYDRLTKHVKPLWSRYAAGDLDLAAVAVATNAAFDLARSMEDEIKPVLSNFGGPDTLLTAYFIATSAASGINVLDKERPGDPFNLEAYDRAQLCLVNSLTIVTSWAAIASPSSVLDSYNGKYGWYNEGVEDPASPPRARWRQDMAVLLELFDYLHILSSSFGGGSLIEDEMTRGIGELIYGYEDGGDMPLWLAWAAQIHLDILRSLGKNCGRGLDDMRQESLRIKRMMLHVPETSPERRAVLKAATSWDKDPIVKIRAQLKGLGIPQDDKRYTEFQFLRRNPIHCGLLIHNMRATLHRSGLQYAAPSGGLLSTVQLYHALREEKLFPEKLVWEDLETLWKMQGNPTFFVGKPPADLEGYFRNYCLSIGVSVSNWAPNRRKGVPSVNTENRRNMKFMGWSSLFMAERLAPARARPALSSDRIEEILMEGRRHQFKDGKAHIQPEMREQAKELEVSSTKTRQGDSS